MKKTRFTLVSLLHLALATAVSIPAIAAAEETLTCSASIKGSDTIYQVVVEPSRGSITLNSYTARADGNPEPQVSVEGTWGINSSNDMKVSKTGFEISGISLQAMTGASSSITMSGKAKPADKLTPFLEKQGLYRMSGTLKLEPASMSVSPPLTGTVDCIYKRR